jgi:hypothetical protein
MAFAHRQAFCVTYFYQIGITTIDLGLLYNSFSIFPLLFQWGFRGDQNNLI